MKLSLKAARKLESSIRTLVSQGMDVTAKIRVQDTWENISDLLKAGSDDVSEKVEDLEKLVKVQYDIRRTIEVSNEKSGLNSLMNKKALLAAEIQVLKSLTQNGEAATMDELKDEVEYQKESLKKERSGYGDKGVTKRLSLLTEEMVSLANSKVLSKAKEIKKIEDELSELNHSEKVSISEESVSLLEKYNLV